MKNFLVIDGNSIVNRAFYGIRLLTNDRGMPTNAVYGFLNIFLKQLEELSPEYVAVAFDMRAKTFRHEQYELYKANRKGMPDDLAVQMPVLKDVLKAMRIKILEKEGYEADDIIGTVSRHCKQQGLGCYILTGDRDDLQLAGDETRIMLVTTKSKGSETTIYTEREVQEAYGMSPREFIDLKAIMGDSSDNIPGVAGIGEKGAAELIRQYKSIEYIYENIDTLDIRPALKNKLIAGRDMAFLSKQLATIVLDVPLEFSLEECRYEEFDAEALLPLLQGLNFNALIGRLGLSEDNRQNAAQTAVDFIPLTQASREDLIKKAKAAGSVYYLCIRREDSLLAAFSPGSGEIYATDESGRALATLQEIYKDEGLVKIGCNQKEDLVFLYHRGIHPRGTLFDIAIGTYLLYPAKPSYTVSDNAQAILDEALPAAMDLSSLAIHLDALMRLKPAIERQIEEHGMQPLLYEVELPLIWVLYDIETHGFLVDKEKLFDFSKKLDIEIEALKKSIYLLAGHEFNINSTKQLGTVLFEELNLPAVKKTKTGFSTDVEVLERLLGKHEIIEYLLEYRTLTKLKSTYADGLFQVIDPQDGKIHSKFNQTVTQTGRLSSTEPNLQNIPIKTDLGREIRRFFIADPGYVLVDADYSQIELRVLAHISGDENLIHAFEEGVDIHSVTAAQVFDVPLSMVTPFMRSSAKAVNFGIVYGISDFGLSQDLKISRKEARQYIDAYFTKYPGVKAYMDSVVEKAKQDGFVTTLYGRRRYLPELSAKNHMTRAFGERMALNTPIQGSAADIIKIAMVRVHQRLLQENMQSRLILQVHDELIVEAKEEEVSRVEEILKYEMEHAAQLRVKLLCDMHTGKSWYDAK